MAWRIRLRGNEACEDQPFITPDLVIKYGAEGAYIDFALAEASETRNVGGLRSRETLATAIIIQLFTDARAYDDDLLPDDLDPDRRGWWGDSIARAPEQGKYNIGSRLWILRRAVLDRHTARRAKEICELALQPIVDQGAVASFVVTTETTYAQLVDDPRASVLAIGVDAYGHDGAKIYSQKFDVLWRQVQEMRGRASRWAA